jgi:sigma-B regulation protein RsbU (phosphoserine phosphatase)
MKADSELRQALKQRDAELDLLNRVQQALASKLDVQAIYDLVGDGIRDIFDVQVVMISILDPATRTVEHRYAIERGTRVYAPGRVPVGGFRAKVVETRQPVLVNRNVAEEAARHGQPTLPGTVTPKSWLGVPMLVGDRVIGILSLQNVDQEDAFKESDVRLLQTVASSMSVALENAHLWEQEARYLQVLEREFDVGREIQAGFLPATLPQPEGWEIAAALLPAREVAGDFYDVFELPGGMLGLVIADVCDKGLGAALFMTLFRSLLRAAANIDFYARIQAPPGGILPAERLKNAVSLTNNYIAETHGSTAMFATVFFGILDLHTGNLAYINGGHLPPMVIGAQGVRETLTITGPAVGALPDIAFTTRETVLGPGELLFACTDGINDTANPQGEYFDPQELLALVCNLAAPGAILEGVQKRLEEFAAGAKHTDDITMLAVRRG